MVRTGRLPRHIALCVVLAGAALAASAARSEAQYFGRNKVQYETFDFRVLRTDHFDLYFYPAESVATADAARMAERWYGRFSRTLTHSFARKPIIFYANHPDFQQTNVIGGFISQGTGGVTESARNRIIMPFTGVYADNDHVLGHELVHVFQYDIAGASQAASRGLNTLPLWAVEGMAEYLSLGREDPNTAMWLRDAALRNDLPTIKQLSTDPKYFPYRYGQALWAYIGGRWGDQSVGALYRAAASLGWEQGIRRVLGVSSDTLSTEWLAAIRDTYLPAMSGRQRPDEAGARVLAREGKTGEMDLGPALSPDGRFVAFFTRRGLFSIDLYVADARTGRIVKKLTGPNRDSHFDAISFISSSGSWSPDGRRFAFVTQAEGDDQISIYDVQSRKVERNIRVRGVGEITGPAWGAGDRIAFSGSAGGISDLYVLDLTSGRLQRLTADRFADLHPSWSPDGRSLAFATDRGPGSSLERLSYAPMRLAQIDLTTGQIAMLPGFAGAKHINPQWSGDGRDLYFVSDRDGFDDIYRLSLADGAIFQVTRLATGVSGITALSPAISLSRTDGRLAFTAFENGGYTLRRLEGERLRGAPVDAMAPGTLAAGRLPPVAPTIPSMVAEYLSDPVTGLPPERDYPVSAYRPSLGLEYIGSPGLGVATGPGGTGVAGGVAGYFTDMLSNRVVGATVMANGSFKDFGGELFYLSQRRRWNWMTGISHVPYLSGFADVRDTVLSSGGGGVPAQVVDQVLQRVYDDEASATVQYPFSQTRRFELGTAVTHLGFDYDVERLFAVDGQVVGQENHNLPAPKGVFYYHASSALVGDWSYFGFTSPVAGGRYRLEYGPTFGQVTFQTLLADYRRYFFLRPVSFALRGIHYARFGKDAESGRLNPLYLGEQWLVRGYEASSFGAEECTDGVNGGGSCPEFDRLIGSRIGVVNAELRIPLFGTEELGLINFPYFPTELAPFVDAGVAWTGRERPDLRFERNTTARVPVVSAGVSARVNLFGYAVGEVYWAYPFQRPVRGGHFGFQLAPGW